MGLERQGVNSLRSVWQELARERNGRLVEANAVVLAASRKGLTVGWRDLMALGLSSPSGMPRTGPADPSIIEAILAYFAEQPARRVLDPWAGDGVLLTALRELGLIESGVGFIRNADNLAVAKMISSTLTGLEWRAGSPRDPVEVDQDEFDALVSLNPIGGRAKGMEFTPAQPWYRETPLPLEEECLALAEHLNVARAVLMMPDRFFVHPRSLYRAPALTLTPNAVFSFSGRLLDPSLSIDLNLVLFSKQPTDRLFVGQIAAGVDPRPLVANLFARRKGDLPELGLLVDRESFRGFGALTIAMELERFARIAGFRPVPIADLVEHITFARKGEGFVEVANAVYVPTVGTSTVVTNLADLQLKATNYVQLVLREDRAIASFVAQLLNRPIGIRQRALLSSGTYIRHVTRSALIEATLYLPPLDRQRETIEASTGLRNWRVELERQESALWGDRGGVSQARTLLNRLSSADPMTYWMDTLPFPLASILWSHDAAREPEEKNDYLIRFFEATSAFFATVLLSAFRDDEAHKRALQGPRSGEPRMQRGTFGGWVQVCRDLAKELRRRSTGQEGIAEASQRLATDRTEVVRLFTDDAVYALLDRGRVFRNLWDGHSGRAGAGVQRQRHLELAALLGEVRETVGDSFHDYRLIKPLRASYSSGVYHNEVKDLTGTRSIFRTIKTDTRIPLESNRTHMKDTNATVALQLLPLFQMLASPQGEENACYFFSEWKPREGLVRMVSHNYLAEPDREILDPVVADVFSSLGSLASASG